MTISYFTNQCVDAMADRYTEGLPVSEWDRSEASLGEFWNECWKTNKSYYNFGLLGVLFFIISSVFSFSSSFPLCCSSLSLPILLIPSLSSPCSFLFSPHFERLPPYTPKWIDAGKSSSGFLLKCCDLLKEKYFSQSLDCLLQHQAQIFCSPLINIC
jgi:hypothetical protein